MDNEAITLSSEFLKIFPILVGGLLAIAGSFSGTLLTHFLKQKSTQKELKRQRLERLLVAANNTNHWLDQYKNSMLSNGSEDQSLLLSPINEAEYLCLLYFPELKNEFLFFQKAYAEYSSLIAKSNLEKIKTGKVPEDFIDEFKVVYKGLSDKHNLLVKKSGLVANEI